MTARRWSLCCGVGYPSEYGLSCTSPVRRVMQEKQIGTNGIDDCARYRLPKKKFHAMSVRLPRPRPPH